MGAHGCSRGIDLTDEHGAPRTECERGMLAEELAGWIPEALGLVGLRIVVVGYSRECTRISEVPGGWIRFWQPFYQAGSHKTCWTPNEFSKNSSPLQSLI
jgi:hypothetical protein